MGERDADVYVMDAFLDRFRAALERIPAETDDRIADRVQDAVDELYVLVEETFWTDPRPVYALSAPRMIQTGLGPALQVYIFHEPPIPGEHVQDMDTTGCEVMVDLGRPPTEPEQGE